MFLFNGGVQRGRDLDCRIRETVSAAELADIALSEKRIEDAGVRATFVGRFLVRLDQMALRGHVERIKDGQAVRWKLKK
ncbi:MAG TPA: hypothetical protein VN663_23000 [Ramlibacter sp.]|nr:hypothetical protein [Ramlibacter sp.]